MSSKLLVWILFAVPDGLMMVISGLGLLGVRRPFRRMFMVGFLVGTATMIFRSWLPWGYHVPIVLVCYCILLVLLLNVSVKTSILACFIASVLVNLGQLLVALPILKATGLVFERTLSDPWLHIGYGWLGESVIFLCSIFVMVRKSVLIPVPESEYPRGADNS